MVYAVILAGGKGLRLNSHTPKQLLMLGNRSVLKCSVDAFVNSPAVDRGIIVCEKGIMDIIRSDFTSEEYPEIAAFVEGGRERSDSSFNALKALPFNDDDIILFHDAARPFVTERIISDVVHKASITGAAGTYIPAVDTVAVIQDSIVKDIPERGNLYYAQTPQGFRYDIIRKAHEKAASGKGSSATDDVSLVMNMGIDVSMVSGEPFNFKITTDYDYSIARIYAESRFP